LKVPQENHLRVNFNLFKLYAHTGTCFWAPLVTQISLFYEAILDSYQENFFASLAASPAVPAGSCTQHYHHTHCITTSCIVWKIVSLNITFLITRIAWYILNQQYTLRHVNCTLFHIF
jgi:hypothetical protein